MPMLQEFGLLLAQKGAYSYALRKDISARGEDAEVDLLAWTKKAPNEVLLAEAKALLTPDEPSENVRAIAELAKAQRQLVRAAQLIKESPIGQRRQLYPFVPWERIDTYRLLIVTPDSQYGHALDESIAPVVTMDAFKIHLRRRDYASPSVLWATCKTRSWLAPYATGPLQYSPTKIGDVTYELPYTGELLGE